MQQGFLIKIRLIAAKKSLKPIERENDNQKPFIK